MDNRSDLRSRSPRPHGGIEDGVFTGGSSRGSTPPSSGDETQNLLREPNKERLIGGRGPASDADAATAAPKGVMDYLMGVPPRFVQYTAIVVSWVVAIGWGAMVKAGPFPFYIPLCMVLWCGLYTLVCRTLILLSRSRMTRPILNYPAYTYYCSLSHGGFFLPLLFMGGVFMAKVLATHDFEGFLNRPWGDSWSFVVLQQVHCAIIGYLLKDYFLVEGGLDNPYIVHHVCSIAGCALCLNFPAASGLVTLDAAQLEFGSAVFSNAALHMTCLNKFIYLVTMVASSVVATWILWRVWILDIDAWWRWAFAVLSFLIVGIRVGGLVVFPWSSHGEQGEGEGEDEEEKES